MSGVLLVTGCRDYQAAGRKKSFKESDLVQPNCTEPSLLKPLEDMRFKAVGSGGGAASCHHVAIRDDGKLMTWGRNEHGQCGGDTGMMVRKEAFGRVSQSTCSVSLFCCLCLSAHLNGLRVSVVAR